MTSSGPLILRYERPGEGGPKRLWLRRTVAAVVVILAGGIGYVVMIARMPRVLVEPPTVERGASGIGKLTTRATLTATTVLAYPKVPGRVADILFNVGTFVRAAQVLGRMESVPLGRAAQADDSALTAAREALTNAQLIPDETRRRTAVQEATRRLSAATRRAMVTRRRLEETYITSPIEGRVTRRLAALGERVVPARHPGARPLAEVMDVSSLRAEADLPVADAAGIRVGAPVRVRLDSVPGRWYRGAVLTVSRGSRGVRISAGLDGGDVRSRPGSAGRMEIQTVTPGGLVESRISVPAGAVHRDVGQTVVWIVHNDRVERRVVDAAAEVDGMREVRSGLTGGELVVVQGPAELRPGERVRAANAPRRPVRPARP